MTDHIHDASRSNAMLSILSFSGTRRLGHGYRHASSVPIIAVLSAAAKAASTTRADRLPALDVRFAFKSQRDVEVAGLDADRPAAATYRLALVGRAGELDPWQ